MSRRIPLVVDADVARAAGDVGSRSEVARACTGALDAIYEVCHQAVFTTELLDEWKKHRSQRAARWQRQMFGKKKVVRLGPQGSEGVRTKILATSGEEVWRREVDKDFHLVDAALRSGQTIISRDGKARRRLGEASATVPEIRQLAWADPVERGFSDWLEQGAVPDSLRSIGSSDEVP